MRLQLLVPIFCYSCFCFHFLLVVSSTADSGDDGLNACVPSTCANLKNVAFPFGAAPSCAVSPSFLLSNCTTKQAYWNNFKATLLGDGAEPPLGPPAVLGISSVGFGIGQVNLTWNRNLIDQNEEAPSICTPAPYSNISDYLPYAINLTVFEDPVFVVSPTNIYLLFNCTNLTSLQSPDFDGRVERNTSNCRSFQTQCKLPDINPNYCLELIPYNQLMLKHVMERRSCTQFQFFATVNSSSQFPSLPLKEWRAGIVHLEWTNSQCANCEKSNGTCKYDQHNNFECSINVAECNFDNLCSTGSKLAIAGVALSLAFAFHGACLLCIFYKSRSRRQIITETDMISVDLNGVCERPMEFSYTALASATASFSTVLGEGGFGVVYKGTVEGSGHTVAVKVLEAKSRHSRGQFLNEITTIGNIHHVNVVRLLGFCVEKSHKILVYEFVANGSLDQWLFKGGGPGKSLGALRAHLDWRQRYAIAVGIARGLCYLHEECRHRIVHCDIKPQNILLDGQMRPKIADFGLAKLMSRGESQVVTLAGGTPGYVAPEFWTGGESLLSSKFDVYSYGMVLLELMSGRRNFVDHCFPAVAFDAAMEEDFKSILDESITKEIDGLLLTSIEWQQVRIATFVALWCIQEHPARRPSMSEVVQYLVGVAAISEQPPRPAIASTTLYPDSPLIRSHFDP